MTDTKVELVARLREKTHCAVRVAGGPTFVNPDGPEAADEIERLQVALEQSNATQPMTVHDDDAEIERFKRYIAMNPAFYPHTHFNLRDSEWSALVWCAKNALLSPTIAEGVLRAWNEVRDRLNKEHGEGIITYREMKAGLNNAAIIRDAALEGNKL
jgi:hypothetical protein